ncbi:MAG: hypothetical protein LH468_11075 [Nocardioides sp.]|nr:hypothetical protein [Nocardioides sp.]
MARSSAFSTAYTGVVALLLVVVAGAGTLLTGERTSGVRVGLEVGWLAAVATLLVIAVVGSRAATGSWPLVVVVAAAVLLAPLVFISATSGGSGSAVLFEVAALVVIAIFAGQLRLSGTDTATP